MSDDLKSQLIWAPVILTLFLAVIGGAAKGCQWDHARDMERIRAMADCSARTGKPLECKAAINP